MLQLQGAKKGVKQNATGQGDCMSASVVLCLNLFKCRRFMMLALCRQKMSWCCKHPRTIRSGCWALRSLMMAGACEAEQTWFCARVSLSCGSQSVAYPLHPCHSRSCSDRRLCEFGGELLGIISINWGSRADMHQKHPNSHSRGFETDSFPGPLVSAAVMESAQVPAGLGWQRLRARQPPLVWPYPASCFLLPASCFVACLLSLSCAQPLHVPASSSDTSSEQQQTGLIPLDAKFVKVCGP